MRTILALAVVLITGCGGSTTDGGAGGNATCSGTSDLSCVAGAPGRACSDISESAVCVDGAWACPSGTIPLEQCGCSGLPAPGRPGVGAGEPCPTIDGGSGDADAAEDGPTETSATETSTDSGSAEVDASDATTTCANGAACTDEGAHCTTTPSCGFPPTITCTCTSGAWTCPPACI